MLKSLQKFLLVAGTVLLTASTSSVFAQLPQAGGPYTPDSNTVILMHFDGADSLAIEAGDNISHPPTAIPYSEDGGLTLPDTSVSAEFGGSLYLHNDTSGSKGEGALYNFLGISHFEGGQYPVPHEQNESDGVHYEAQSIEGDMTVEYWFRIEEPNVYGYHTVINKAGNEHADWNNGEVDPFHWQFWHYNYNLQLPNDGTFQADWANPAQNLIELRSETPVWESDKWYHHVMIKDTSARQKIDLVLDRNKNLIHSEFTTFPASHTKSDTIIHNDIIVGANPHYTIGDNNYPSDPLGDASAVGNRFYREFYGNLDELRISNTARHYQDLLVGNLYTLQGDEVEKPEVVSNRKDSLRFALSFAGYGNPDSSRTVTFHYNTGSGYQDTTLNQVGEHRHEIMVENFAAGNTINYYFTGSIGGTQVASYPEGASDGLNNLSFFVDFPPERALKLSFEEGEQAGAIYDSSGYDQDVTIVGDTSYNNFGFDGTWSYEINQNNQLALINTPSVASYDISVDMWFRANEMPSNRARLIAKEGMNDSSMVNYSIYFEDGALRGHASGAGTVELDTSITSETWYRVLYMINQNAHSIQLWNSDGELIAYDVESTNGQPLRDDGPLYIGQGNFYPDSAFNGLVDGVEIHTYAAKTGPFLVKNTTQLISESDTLAEYPVEAVVHNSGSGQINSRLHYRGGFGWTFQNMNLENESTGLYTHAITQQDAQTIVPYYFTFNNSRYSEEVPEGAGQSDDSTNYTVAVYETYSKVLDIDFEQMENGLPVDNSTYSEFNDLAYRVEGGQAPTYINDAAQGNRAMNIQRQDSSYLTVDSKFLSTDELTISMWVKPTDFDPEYVSNSTFSYWQAILFLTKYKPNSWQVDNIYELGFNNEPESGEPNTIRARVDAEGGDTYDVIDMDSTVTTGNWYRIVTEYNRNDTTFTHLYNSDGELIEEVGANTEGFGPMLKAETPLTIGAYNFDAASIYGGNMYSGYIDDVQIYNYAATTKPPQVSNVTSVDSAFTGSAVTINADVRRNGMEEVYLVTRTVKSSGTTAWDSTKMEVNYTDVTYSADIPSREPGSVVEYWIGTQNDFGVTTTSEAKRVPFYMEDQTTETLVLDFESGSGQVVDHSGYNWTIKRAGKLASSPTFTRDAIKGKYALAFEAADSTYLKIDAPYPFLNHQTFTVDLWVKSHTENNTNVRLLGKPGTDVFDLSWWQQNFEMKGIGGGSWTLGGFLSDTSISEFGNRFIANHIGDSTNFGSEQVKTQLEDSTWYHVRYVQDIENDSVHAAITTADGQTVVQTSMEIPGTQNMAPVFTHGALQIGHSGPANEPYFDGVIDHVTISRTIPEALRAPAGPGQDLPDKFSLGDNYPNPFNPTTTINYALPKSTDVTLKVYNLLGREVATLVNSKQKAGRHQLKFDASDLASGVYFYRISTPEFNKVRKMMLIK